MVAKEHHELVNVLYNAIQREHSLRKHLKRAERSGDQRVAALMREFASVNDELITRARTLLFESMVGRK